MQSAAVLRLATRASALAVWQANHVASLVRAAHGGLQIELITVSTEGDRRLDAPLSELGGKGIFATEVQAAVLDGRADFAVHSAKDLPAVTADELCLAAIPERGDARDALVGTALKDLPVGAVVATGSARRRALLAELRPDLQFEELRGNMATRLAKADQFDAIVVAAVAFMRLGLQDHLKELLAVDAFVPQVGQGALAIECRAQDDQTARLLAAIEHSPSRRCVDTERAFLAELGGDCSLPAAAHAVVQPDNQIALNAVLANQVGGRVLHESAIGSHPELLGRSLAVALRHQLSHSGDTQ
ncbi:MAG: hydroxymethylbilane synthase [Microthrixaceae bacterium]